MSALKPLSVQSYCFRKFAENARVAGLVTEIGLSGLEICGVHIDFSDLSAHQGVIDTYRSAGVSIVSLGVNAMSGDEAGDRPLFEFAKRAGCPMMSVDFRLADLEKSLPVAERLAEEYDLPLGIHNHGGHHWLGNTEALRFVFGRSTERIGLCLDTAWALDSREDPIKWIREFRGRVHALHLKDMIFGRDGKPVDTVIGVGNLNLTNLSSSLADTGFGGLSIIEFEGEPENPVPDLKKCVSAIRASLGKFFS